MWKRVKLRERYVIGPDGLTYLRSLDIVDRANIGLEGHSMGGWAVLIAAAGAPNDYRSVVIEGSSCRDASLSARGSIGSGVVQVLPPSLERVKKTSPSYP